MLRLFWPCFLIFAIPATASVQFPSPNFLHVVIQQREKRLWNSPTRASEFSDITHASARCENTQLPEALTTPDPLIIPAAAGNKVKISFIVGADGRVHSPLILQSAGRAYDRNILQTVRAWRYRPATCNGVPTESEGKIEFSQR
ncbi:MAG: TonB family protein [Candidatus Sulfotelmatobacter sp.]|jgi:TonB family protein